MNRAIEKVWADEVQRLRAARTQFFESLHSIRELAHFAATQREELDRNVRLVFQISSKDIEGITEEEGRLVRTAFVDFLNSVQSAMGHSTPEGKREAIEKLGIVFDEANQRFREAIPEGIDPAVIWEFVSAIKPRTRTELLLSSLLITAVSDFEVLFSAVATFFYRMRPEGLRAQDSMVSWREIEAYASLDDLRTHFIEERVDNLMRDGYDGWMKWLETQVKIKSEEPSLDPSVMYEAFQRRHILVHSGGRVSPQYLAKVNWLSDPPMVGVELKVDQEYLDAAIDELTAAGASLSLLLMRKLCPRTRHGSVDSDAETLTYELLSQGRLKLVDKIARIALPGMTQEYSRTAVRVNRWIALKKLAGIKAIAEEVANWDISALQDIFKLTRLILLDDPAAIHLAREMLATGNLTEEQIELWPLFDDIRPELLDNNAGA